MEPKDYIVVKIEGEYAYLREIGADANADLFIALALLPSAAISAATITSRPPPVERFWVSTT